MNLAETKLLRDAKDEGGLSGLAVIFAGRWLQDEHTENVDNDYANIQEPYSRARPHKSANIFGHGSDRGHWRGKCWTEDGPRAPRPRPPPQTPHPAQPGA